MDQTPFITLDGITVRIGDRWLLNGLSWQIKRHENWVIWGLNGAGKTTLAKTLMDMLPVVQGSIHRHYEEDGDAGAYPSCPMAIISSEQHTHLYLQEQLLEEMSHFSANPDLATKTADVLHTIDGVDPKHWEWVVRQLGLVSMLSKPISALSTGEMRKLLIGRAFMVRPRMLILDEPFNGLDIGFQPKFMALLDHWMADGVQMVLITHRPREIPSSFTRLIHLEEGRVKWKGDLRDFFPPRRDDIETGKRPPPTLVEKVERPSLPKYVSGTALPLITMRNVSVNYGSHHVLTRVNWTVNAGENWAVIGPNGAGKSTLLRLITGDNLQAYANELVIFGRPRGSGESVWEIKQQIGYVSDEVHLRYQKKMSGFDVVCSGFFDSIGLYRYCTPAQKQTAHMWFKKTGTENLSRNPYTNLSFGQQRMILILRAMVKKPRLLILDEPCNGLDQVNRQQLLHMLNLVGQSTDTNLLYVSHRADEIPTCITHKLHLDGGRVT